METDSLATDKELNMIARRHAEQGTRAADSKRKNRIYYCVVCDKTSVNAEDGFDTCDSCLSNV